MSRGETSSDTDTDTDTLLLSEAVCGSGSYTTSRSSGRLSLPSLPVLDYI